MRRRRNTRIWDDGDDDDKEVTEDENEEEEEQEAKTPSPHPANWPLTTQGRAAPSPFSTE